jgi:hypothetical protein
MTSMDESRDSIKKSLDSSGVLLTLLDDRDYYIVVRCTHGLQSGCIL